MTVSITYYVFCSVWGLIGRVHYLRSRGLSDDEAQNRAALELLQRLVSA